MQPGILVLLIRLGSGGLRFLGDPTCPDRTAVEAQLRLLDPKVLESASKRQVMLEKRPDGLRVVLLDVEGKPLEERFLPGKKSCEEWARVAAALVATWAMEVHAPEMPPPGSWPKDELHAVQHGNGEAAEVSADEANRRWELEIGAGLSGSVANNGSGALGGGLLAGLAPPAQPYGGRLTLTGTGMRSVSLGGGTANWQIFAAGLGGYGALGSESLKVDFAAEFLAGLLNVKGEGVASPQSHQVFDPGIGLSGRVSWRFTRSWSTWVGFGVSLWPKTQNVQVGAPGTGASTTLPTVDYSVTLGVSLATGI